MRILLVEDDKLLCETVGTQLEQAGYQVDLCFCGDDALYYATEYPYDVLVLDRMLPNLDGLSLLQAVRLKHIMTPVIITTALDGIGDRIDGLDAGADDYLVKPFAVEELLARIRAVTRRPGRTADTEKLTFANLCLDTVKHELTLYDRFSGQDVSARQDVSAKQPATPRPVTLSGRESSLLEYLMRNADRTLPRSAILSYVWGPDSEVEAGNLDNYIYFLRRRLKSLHGNAKIQTVHGVGYRLEELND